MTVAEESVLSQRSPAGQASWLDAAACRGRDTALWFSADRFEQAVAIAVCRGCPVRADCLAEALALEDGTYMYGIRGGLRVEQRRRRLAVTGAA